MKKVSTFFLVLLYRPEPETNTSMLMFFLNPFDSIKMRISSRKKKKQAPDKFLKSEIHTKLKKRLHFLQKRKKNL
jgi:hypothetical protein